MAISTDSLSRHALALILTALCLVPAGSQAAPAGGQALARARRHAVEKFHSPHVPLAIHRVGNLQGGRFIDGLELEVKNISPRPIYYIRLGVSFPDFKVDGKTYGFFLRYGRDELVDIDTRAGPNDEERDGM